MLLIKPYQEDGSACECGGKLSFDDLIWQGLHVCAKYICKECGREVIKSLPVNQANIEQYSFHPGSGLLLDNDNKPARENWFSSKLKEIARPVNDKVEVDVEIIKKYDEIIILNSLDYIYGHSLLFLLNLQRLIRASEKPGIVVLVQPALKWLVPRSHVAEIWTARLGFNELKNYHPDLSQKINSELKRFSRVWISRGHVIPTNENIEIEGFTGIKPYDFARSPVRPRITFIWREDPDRLWIRNFYILKGFKKLGFKRILLPFHYFRVLRFLRTIRKELGTDYIYSVAGLGTSYRMPSFIDDRRYNSFNEEIERELCMIYSESELVIGVHGSSMLLPSAHSGMAVSMMPSRRWGNFAEDILFRETDPRVASFLRRIIPLNLGMNEVRDIVTDMIKGRKYFMKKFIHPEEL